MPMITTAHSTPAIAGAMLLGVAFGCAVQAATPGGVDDQDREMAKLRLELKQARERSLALARDLAASKKREAELSAGLNDLRLRFAALGDNLLNGGQDAILEAVKNAEVLDKQYRATEKAAIQLMADMREYLRTAVVADPDARAQLETSIRELDLALGLRQNPRPQTAQGSLQHAKIVSVDAKSGVLVVNAGEDQSVRRGMTFTIMRGNHKVAEAIAADVRKDFSGLLPTQLDDLDNPVRSGDIASVKITQQ
jgi:hypothetical protein